MAYSRMILAAWSIPLLAAVAFGQQPSHKPQNEETGETKGRFLRLVRNDDNSLLAMETAIVRCVPKDSPDKGLTVDLVAAVHVGEKSYYQRLNQEFTKYDAVLYELVASEKAKIPKNGRSDNPVSALQNGMKSMLGLEFQLDWIDYGRENMVHADMSPQQFAGTMNRRGESVFSMFLRMMGYAMAKQNGGGKTSDLQLLLALFDRNRALALKRVMAEQFEDMDGSLMALDGPGGSTIVSERNKVALEVLRKQLAAGKQRIAIFYGAGHMADLQRRLRDDFGMIPVETHWLVAWNLAPAGTATGSKSRHR